MAYLRLPSFVVMRDELGRREVLGRQQGGQQRLRRIPRPVIVNRAGHQLRGQLRRQRFGPREHDQLVAWAQGLYHAIAHIALLARHPEAPPALGADASQNLVAAQPHVHKEQSVCGHLLHKRLGQRRLAHGPGAQLRAQGQMRVGVQHRDDAQLREGPQAPATSGDAEGLRIVERVGDDQV